MALYICESKLYIIYILTVDKVDKISPKLIQNQSLVKTEYTESKNKNTKPTKISIFINTKIKIYFKILFHDLN